MTKSGFFLINKPFGWTSFDVVQYLKRRLRLKKAGHAGTLDPIATGLLIVLAEQYTVKFDTFSSGVKEYKTRILVGCGSDTDDVAGTVFLAKSSDVEATKKTFEKKVKDYLDTQRGEIYQKAPAFSSIKHKGKPLYEYARNGEHVETKMRKVFIHDIKIKKIAFPFIDIVITADRGFYVRSFSRDIGKYLGLSALMLELERTRIGDYRVNEAKDIRDVTLKDIQN